MQLTFCGDTSGTEGLFSNQHLLFRPSSLHLPQLDSVLFLDHLSEAIIAYGLAVMSGQADQV
jgi:hypothetical protein